MSSKTNSSGKKWIVGIQILLSLCGTVLCGWNLIRTFQSPLTLLINTFNLIAFANAIMGSSVLEKKKDTIGYLGMAAILKLIGELVLIIKHWEFVNFQVILLSLSVPVLGLTILLAYITLYRPKD